MPVGNLVVEELARHFDVAGLTRPTSLSMISSRRHRESRCVVTDPARSGNEPLKVANLPPGTTFHALRHYYASLLIRHGESVKVVQERLGHASAAETLDTYSHLWPDSEDRTRQAVDEALGGRFRDSAGREISRNATATDLAEAFHTGLIAVHSSHSWTSSRLYRTWRPILNPTGPCRRLRQR